MSAVLKRLVALLALMLALGLCGLAESPELDLTDAEEPALMVETVEPQTDETELELEEAWSEYSPEHSLAAASVTVRLGVGEKYAIPTVEGAGDPTYSSKNKKIATVSTAGVIKGRKKGKTTVTATSGGGGIGSLCRHGSEGSEVDIVLEQETDPLLRCVPELGRQREAQAQAQQGQQLEDHLFWL